MTRKQRGTRLIVALVAIAGANVLGVAPATPARAGPAGGQPSAGGGVLGAPPRVLDRMRAQVPLVSAATALQTAVERGAPGGYAGIGLTDGHVTLWWKGALPAPVAKAVKAAQAVAPVTVAPARYSRTELRQAARTVRTGIGADRPDAPYAVKLATDGSGLEVSVDTAVSAPTVPEVDVPTRIVREAPLKPRSRDDDTPLWRGGTIMWTDTGAGCTAGFGVRDPSGARYILTAAHCGPTGGQWRDGEGELIGAMGARHQPHDVGLIPTAEAGDTMYAGGLDDEHQLVVSGWTEVFPGQLLCQSGRTMAWITGGPMCNIEVKFHYTDEEDLVEATQLDDLEVAYSGDSGGPVYALGANGTILAAGTVTRSGGAGLGFQDFATARADFGIEPLTGSVGTCHVTYAITDSWGSGFNANVTIRNDGPAVSGWSLGWTFTGPGIQHINGAWNAYASENGQRITATNAQHNGAIAAGGSTSFGFTADGPPTTPGLFSLNGAYCG